jgi:predicted dehydrogenase
MTAGKARAGVIGLGRHGFRHLQAYTKVADVEIAAVCDVRPEVVQEACDLYPTARGYVDWQQLLSEEKLDVLSVVTNGPTHAAVTIAAATRGIKHILCEKPMATSVCDAAEMIRVCHEQSTRLAISHARRWVPGYQTLRARLQAGLIGKPSHLWCTSGGGLFAGNGTHFMDLARMLTGSNPVMVVASMDQSGKPNPRGAQFQDPGGVAMYWFENGVRLVIDLSEDISLPPRFEIAGSAGRVLIDEVEGRWEIGARAAPENGSQSVSQNWWDPLEAIPFDSVSLDMVDMMATGLKELLSDREITCTGEDGLATLEMVIGAHVSHRQGHAPIKLPLAEEYWQIDIPFT